MEALAYKHEQRFSNERLGVHDDVVTQFAELVDGSMRTEFKLTFDGNELYGMDGRGMGEVTKDALEEAEAMVRKNPNLGWELRRRKHEKVEYELALQMARGELPNTMVIPSDFPEELMDADEDLGGYNVGRKQTMNRVLALMPDGSVQLYTQSLDGSNREALEAIYGHFGLKPVQGELLGQRIHVDLSHEEQVNLIDRLTGIYDRSMSAQFGGEWYAGRKPADYRNTFDFVRSQKDIVKTCVELKLNGKLNARMMYDMAATMQQRFKHEQTSVTNIATRTADTNPIELRREFVLAGQEAREKGMAFSACGATLKADGTSKSMNEFEQAGLGNKIDADKAPWHGGKRIKNKKCNSCQEIKPEVGACHICEDCVKHPKKGGLLTIQSKLDVSKKREVKKSGEKAPVINLEEKRREKQTKIGNTAIRETT